MGGGTMRTAAKLARSGFRGTYPAEKQLSRNRASSPIRVLSQGTKTADVKPLHTAVPTLKEAEEATAVLKEAIDQIYLSPANSQIEKSYPGSELSVLSPSFKDCLVEAISNPSVHNHAIHAIQLFRSVEVQTVLQSIVCDPNIWNDVMQNPAVISYFESKLAVANSTNGAAFAGSGFVETPEKEEKPESQSGNAFDFMAFLPKLKLRVTEMVSRMAFLPKLKLRVTEMVSRMSNFFQNKFPTEEDKSSADADGGSFMDYNNVVGGIFMRLAVMVIMVVLMKRA